MKKVTNSIYTKKVKLPIFEPNECDVNLTDLLDVDKYFTLLTEINEELSNNNITPEEAKFLKFCATRWIKFNFANVAQYYATKANPSMQKLLERSAMILIDINKAFESGIVESNKFINNIIDQNHNSDIQIETFLNNNKKVLENDD